MPTLSVASFLETSTVDYPGQLSAVVWLSGCPFRCGYCQNADVAIGKIGEDVDTGDIATRLVRIRPFIDALTITGGEPTMQKVGLLDLLRKAKTMGLLTHVNTNGYYPQELSTLLPFLDYVSIDIKRRLDPALYGELTGADGKAAVSHLRTSLSLLRAASCVTVEARTTIVHGLNDSCEEIMEIAKEISWVDTYVLRRFCDRTVLDDRFSGLPKHSREDIARLASCASRFVRVVAD